MKKLYFIFVFAVLCCVSCRFEEPSASIHAPEERIVGNWFVASVKKNDQKSVDSLAPLGNIHYCYHNFYINQQFSVTTYSKGVRLSSVRGDWAFEKKYKGLKIFYVLENERFSHTAEVIKLSNKKLKYRYTDIKGDKWEFEMTKQI